VIGSYGWGGKALEQIKAMLYNVKAEVFTPVIAKGLPGDSDYKALEELAVTIKQKHESIGIL
jgi:flavorubredoxin